MSSFTGIKNGVQYWGLDLLRYVDAEFKEMHRVKVQSHRRKICFSVESLKKTKKQSE